MSERGIKTSGAAFTACDPCSKEGEVRPAYKYCKMCSEFFCKTCVKSHQRLKVTQTHILLEVRQMPEETPLERVSPLYMCETHVDSEIEYFCKNHSTIACTICVLLHHKMCSGICDIATVSDDPRNDQRFRELSSKIKTLESNTDKIFQTANQNHTKTYVNKMKAKADIKQFCEDIREHLYKIEYAIDEEVDQFAEEDNKHMDMIQQECEAVSADLKNVTAMLESSEGPSRRVQQFIAIEKGTSTVEALDQRLATLSKHNTMKDFTFESDERLIDVITYVHKAGQLIASTSGYEAETASTIKSEAGESSSWNFDTVTTETEADINVSTAVDENTCRITGSAMMEGETTLAVADFSNKSVKLVEINERKVISQTHLPSWPWDISEIPSHQLAVTLPSAKKIQILRLNDGTSLSRVRQIDVSGECRGVAYHDESLYVSFTNPGQVQILNLTGHILKLISSRTDELIQFTRPYYITLNGDLTAVYVTDLNSSTVYCLTLDGGVKARYRDKDFSRPCGLCVVPDGSVIACCGQPDKLYVISSDFTRGRVLVEESRDLRSPDSVAYNHRLSTLYVGQYNTDKLRVFRLK